MIPKKKRKTRRTDKEIACDEAIKKLEGVLATYRCVYRNQVGNILEAIEMIQKERESTDTDNCEELNLLFGGEIFREPLETETEGEDGTG